MAPTLKAQKERKNAYHLALKFLSTATLKENPEYNLEKYAPSQAEELKPLLERFLENKLNELVKHESAENPLIRNTAPHHPVIQGPW